MLIKTLFLAYAALASATISVKELAESGSVIHQIHLSLTENSPGEMMVKFVTFAKDNVTAASVSYVANTQNNNNLRANTQKLTVQASTSTYNVGTGWHGTVFTAVINNLTPDTEYLYWVNTAPEIRGPYTFKTSSTPEETVLGSYVAVLADHGTFMPLGFVVTDAVIWDNNATSPAKNGSNPTGPFDMALLVGDISYAYLDRKNFTEIEYIWDVYGDEIEPFTMNMPFMTTVGNHESFSNFTAYKTRYTMPGGKVIGAEPPFWYSYDYEGVHYVSMSSEHDYSAGSPQRLFLEEDLKTASNPLRKAIVPWTVFLVHRPLYSTESSDYNDHSPGGPLTDEIGNLLMQYSVDLCLTGHMHSYERTHAVYNGTVMTYPQGSDNVYVNPDATIFVVQGTSGALQLDTFVQPQPSWSARRDIGVYGYGRMKVHNTTYLSYEFVDIKANVIDQFAIKRQP